MKREIDDEDGGGLKSPSSPLQKKSREEEKDGKPAAEKPSSVGGSEELSSSEAASSLSGFDKVVAAASNRFPNKMYGLLEQQVAPEALWWSEQGDAIMINKKQFTEQLLNKHFHGNKMETVTRNLNRWGFKQGQEDLSLPRGIVVYAHPLFRRDAPEKLEKIAKEKRSEESKAKAAAKAGGSTSPMSSPTNRTSEAESDFQRRLLGLPWDNPQQQLRVPGILQQSQFLQQEPQQSQYQHPALRTQDQMTFQSMNSNVNHHQNSSYNHNMQQSNMQQSNTQQSFLDNASVILEQALQRVQQDRQQQQPAMMPSNPSQGISPQELLQRLARSQAGDNRTAAQPASMGFQGGLLNQSNHQQQNQLQSLLQQQLRQQQETSDDRLVSNAAAELMRSEQQQQQQQQQQQPGLLEQAAALRASLPGIPEETLLRMLLEQQQQQDSQPTLLDRLMDAERRRQN